MMRVCKLFEDQFKLKVYHGRLPACPTEVLLSFALLQPYLRRVSLMLEKCGLGLHHMLSPKDGGRAPLGQVSSRSSSRVVMLIVRNAATDQRS